MADWSNDKMHWYDWADKKAWPVGLLTFVVAAVVLFLAGLGVWSLVTALAFGAGGFNIYAGRIRRRARRREQDSS